MLRYAPRILVVDDEPAVRTFVERILSEDGYFVYAVGSARRALDALVDGGMFEVAVVDLSLPDCDGIDLVRQMRTDVPHLSILATSGFLVGDMPDIVRAAGAMATLAKPATRSELRNAIYRLLEPSGVWVGTKPVCDLTKGPKASMSANGIAHAAANSAASGSTEG